MIWSSGGLFDFIFNAAVVVAVFMYRFYLPLFLLLLFFFHCNPSYRHTYHSYIKRWYISYFRKKREHFDCFIMGRNLTTAIQQNRGREKKKHTTTAQRHNIVSFVIPKMKMQLLQRKITQLAKTMNELELWIWNYKWMPYVRSVLFWWAHMHCMNACDTYW